MNVVPPRLREIENMHIVLWLLKDTCWVMLWRTGGMLMIVPTITVAIYITWLSRKTVSELLHNIAVVCWICANSIWMTGEFFYNDRLRPIATVFFLAGIGVVTVYYLLLWIRRLKGINAS